MGELRPARVGRRFSLMVLDADTHRDCTQVGESHIDPRIDALIPGTTLSMKPRKLAGSSLARTSTKFRLSPGQREVKSWTVP